ncbi:MAG: hypothetical protein ACI80P_001807, partial [Flavobacteriales bacterium]
MVVSWSAEDTDVHSPKILKCAKWNYNSMTDNCIANKHRDRYLRSKLNDLYFLLSLLFIGAVALIIRNYLKRSPSLKVDYSFGNANLLALKVAVRAKQFKEAEVLIGSFEVNMRTLAIDHLALTCTTLELQSWVTSNGGTGYDGLALAGHYGFLNWSFEQTKS